MCISINRLKTWSEVQEMAGYFYGITAWEAMIGCLMDSRKPNIV